MLLSVLFKPTFADCQIVQQSHAGVASNSFTHSSLSETSKTTSITEAKKNKLREALGDKVQKYSGLPPNKRLLILLKHEGKLGVQKSEGGAWSGGGGTGIACPLADDRLETDNLGRLSADALEKISSLQMIDLISVPSEKTMPALPGEKPLEYINRLLDLYATEAAPLFSIKMKQLSKMVAEQLDEQIESYKILPSPKHLEPLYDYGPAVENYKTHIGTCKFVQLATRYAQTDILHIYDFFLDFDISLVLKMREVSHDPVVSEASLILHEASYLLASTFLQQDSVETAFKIIPFLFNKDNAQVFSGLSHPQAALQFKAILKDAGFGAYYEALLPEAAQDPKLDQHLAISTHTIQRSVEIAAQTDLMYIIKGHQGLPSPQDMISSAVEFSHNDLETLLLMRGSEPWLRMCYDLIEAENNDELSFYILSSNVSEKSLIDDLILRTPYSAQAKVDFCAALKKDWQDNDENRNPYPNMQKTFHRAFRYCEKILTP